MSATLLVLPAVPLLIVLIGACLVLALPRHDHDAAARLAGLALAAAAAASLLLQRGGRLSALGLTADAFTTTMGVVLCVVAAAAVLVASRVRPHRLHLVVVLLMVAAGVVAVGARDLFAVLAALGIVWTGAAYTAGGLPDERGVVPLVRFGIMAGAAAILALFGGVLTFVATGVTTIDALRQRTAAMSLDPGLLLLVALAFIAAGSAFALLLPLLQAAATDDVDADGAVTTLLASTATLAAVTRLLATAFDPIRAAWLPVVSAAAGVLMVSGGVAAVAQVRLHHALAWLGLAWGGFAIAALVPMSAAGTEAAVLLIAVPAGALSGAIAVAALSEHRDEPRPLAGFGWRDTPGGIVLTICLLALAGLPLTVGFTARWHLAIAMGVEARWELGVAVMAAGAIVLLASARLVRRIWEPLPAPVWSHRQPERPRVPIWTIVLAAALVGGGLWSAPVLAAARRAAAALF